MVNLSPVKNVEWGDDAPILLTDSRSIFRTSSEKHPNYISSNRGFFTHHSTVDGPLDLATVVLLARDGYTLGGERVNSDGDERGAQLVHTDRNGEEQWSTVTQDDDEIQQYTASAIVDG